MHSKPSITMNRRSTIVRKYSSSYMTAIWVLLIVFNLLVMVVNLAFIFANKNQQQQQQQLEVQSKDRIPHLKSLSSPPELSVREEFSYLRASQRESQSDVESFRHDSWKTPVHETHTFVLRGDNWDNLTSSWPVCLSTQASADLLFWVVDQTRTWRGPISVAVYVPDSDFDIAMKMIDIMLSCSDDVRKRVSFHVTYPVKYPPKTVRDRNSRLLDYGCDQIEMYNEYLLSEMNGTLQSRVPIHHQPLFPQNLLRNIARDSCKSNYVFTPDIDMILAPSMDEQLKSFLKRPDVRRCRKCAFIIPTYEISTSAPRNPVDKPELLWFLKNKMARRFHAKTFKPSQANSQLKLWERSGRKLKKEKNKNDTLNDSLLKEANGTLKVLYDITTWENFWEPVYVAQDIVPPFDERFLGYECTRSSQVYEMFMAKFRWRMLNEAFLCHRGFQNKRARHLWSQINKNFKLFQDFKKEIEGRYGFQLKTRNVPDEIWF